MVAVQCCESGLAVNGYSDSSDAFYGGYQPHMLSTANGMLHWDQNSGNVNSFSVSHLSPQPQPQHAKDGKNNDDPYLCSVCDFVTVYKVRLVFICLCYLLFCKYQTLACVQRWNNFSRDICIFQRFFVWFCIYICRLSCADKTGWLCILQTFEG